MPLLKRVYKQSLWSSQAAGLSSWFIVHRKTTDYKLQTTNWRKMRSGFTLVELLVVIAILAITTSLITASYVSFEKRQRLADAAKTLVSDIRLTQNKALSGDKNDPDCEDPESKLVGWFIRLDSSDPLGLDDESGYSIYSLCGVKDADDRSGSPSEPVWESYKTYNFPPKINLTKFTCVDADPDSAALVILHVLFESLKNDVTVWAGFETPPFYDKDGKAVGTRRCKNGDLAITLQDKSGNEETVTILKSGAIQ